MTPEGYRKALTELLTLLRAQGVLEYEGPVWSGGQSLKVEFVPPSPGALEAGEREVPPEEILDAAREEMYGKKCDCGHLMETEHGPEGGCLFGCDVAKCSKEPIGPTPESA